MSEATVQSLLRYAEELREQRDRVLREMAYTAPELWTDQLKQWVASTEAFIDLLDFVAASSDEALQEKTLALATALMSATMDL